MENATPTQKFTGVDNGGSGLSTRNVTSMTSTTRTTEAPDISLSRRGGGILSDGQDTQIPAVSREQAVTQLIEFLAALAR